MEKLELSAPYAAMAGAIVVQVGLIIISKNAFSNGMSNYVFIAYSNALAAVILLPASFFMHRSIWSAINLKLISGFFMLGIIGCAAQITGYVGIDYTSATFASAMLNLVPGFTFVLAVLSRIEKVDFRTSSTIAKSIGTVVSIGGAFILTLYKGPQILMASLPSSSQLSHLHEQNTNLILGGLFLAVDCLMSSTFTIVQAFILKDNPAELIMVFFYCFFAAILSALVSLVSGTGLSAWSLQSSTRLLSVLYSGVLGSAVHVSLTTWSIHKKGPLFVVMFHPLGIVIAAFYNIVISKDAFYLGSFLGSIVIVIGFYAVMWGIAKGTPKSPSEENTEADGESSPLLLAESR